MTDTILYVEDSDGVRTAVARMLARRFQVRAVASAEEAVAAFDREGPFPVVLADWELPGLDGIALLRELRGHAPDSVGVLLTGRGDLDLAARATREAGVFRLLAKPCGYEPLIEALDAALGRHRDLAAAGDEVEELAFVRDALEDLQGLLEERVVTQRDGLQSLRAFARDVTLAGSLREIADCAARGAARALGRGALVQLWDGTSAPPVQAAAGPEMSPRLHVVPLETRDGRVGELVVDLPADPAQFDEAERAALASIAAATALAVHHELRRRERDGAEQATILALARLAEQRDDETGRHLQRLAAYCRALAEALRDDGHHTEVITDEWVHDLALSSALHDIGKVGIPDAVLLKTSPLSAEEWRVMQQHAEIGERTLQSVIDEVGPTRFLVLGRQIAGSHHERWDGQGYPRGLVGSQIPLAARVLAVADVYDALTTARPYKSAWTHEEAVAWIRGEAGAHFDPEVAEAFLRRGGEFDVLRGRLSDA